MAETESGQTEVEGARAQPPFSCRDGRNSNAQSRGGEPASRANGLGGVLPWRGPRGRGLSGVPFPPLGTQRRDKGDTPSQGPTQPRGDGCPVLTPAPPVPWAVTGEPQRR